MVIPEWLAANALLLVIISLAVWLARNYLAALIAESVKADFSASIEKLRAELREKEETLRADLRAKELAISSLRDGAMANVRHTQAALFQRRLQAADELWSGVVDWSKFNSTLMFVSLIRSNTIMDQLKAGDAEAVAMAEEMLKAAPRDMNGVGDRANLARPHVSDLAWALYIAYVSLFAWSVSVARMFKPSDAKRRNIPAHSLEEVLIKALPDMKEYIKGTGAVGYYHVADTLRERIVTELKVSLAGREQDSESVARAADIIQAAEAALRVRAEQDAKAKTG